MPYKQLTEWNACIDSCFNYREIGGEISITTTVFILDYLQEKLRTKFYKEPKNPIWAHFDPFWPNLCKNECSWKWALAVFRYSNYPASCKNQKKVMTHSWEKHQIDGQTDRQIDRKTNRQTDGQTDRQTDKKDLIGPSIWERFNYPWNQ